MKVLKKKLGCNIIFTFCCFLVIKETTAGEKNNTNHSPAHIVL